MAQWKGRPDLTGDSLETGDWYDDEQGVDYELIFGEQRQYCFMAVGKDPLVLSFMAHSYLSEDDLRGHPELHERKVPTEVSEWFVGKTLAHLEHGVDTCRRFTITGIESIERRGDNDGEDQPNEYEEAVFETEGQVPVTTLTDFELIRALVTGSLQIVEPVTQEVTQ